VAARCVRPPRCTARPGWDPEPIQIEDTETIFAIAWKGQYRIEGSAFVYMDGDTGRATAILGYPTQKLAPMG
jgi:hypothetical protein